MIVLKDVENKESACGCNECIFNVTDNPCPINAKRHCGDGKVWRVEGTKCRYRAFLDCIA